METELLNSDFCGECANRTSLYDGKLHDFNDFKHNISEYFQMEADFMAFLNREPGWIAGNEGIGMVHHSLASVVPLLLHSAIIYLSFFSKHMPKKPFKIFFGNLSIASFLFCSARQATHMADWSLLYFSHRPFNIYTCTISSTVVYVFGSSTIFSTFTTIFHRYEVNVKLNTQYFTKPKIVLMCLSCYFPILWPVFLLVTQNKIVYSMQVNCRICFYSDIINLTLLVLPVAIAEICQAYYICRLHLFLSKNMNELAVRLRKPVSEVIGNFFPQEMTIN